MHKRLTSLAPIFYKKDIEKLMYRYDKCLNNDQTKKKSRFKGEQCNKNTIWKLLVFF